jgi:hypothetical protein
LPKGIGSSFVVILLLPSLLATRPAMMTFNPIVLCHADLAASKEMRLNRDANLINQVAPLCDFELRNDWGVIRLRELNILPEGARLIRQCLIVDLCILEISEHRTRNHDVIQHLPATKMQQ